MRTAVFPKFSDLLILDGRKLGILVRSIGGHRNRTKDTELYMQKLFREGGRENLTSSVSLFVCAGGVLYNGVVQISGPAMPLNEGIQACEFGIKENRSNRAWDTIG